MTGRRNSPRYLAPSSGGGGLDAGRSSCKSPGGSYMEVWISAGRIDVFERQGDGETAQLIEVLRKLGLEMRARTVSFCG